MCTNYLYSLLSTCWYFCLLVLCFPLESMLKRKSRGYILWNEYKRIYNRTAEFIRGNLWRALFLNCCFYCPELEVSVTWGDRGWVMGLNKVFFVKRQIQVSFCLNLHGSTLTDWHACAARLYVTVHYTSPSLWYQNLSRKAGLRATVPEHMVSFW